MRSLGVLLVSLVLVGVASAAGPSSVGVLQGVLLHGDAESLAAIDGDTLDIQSIAGRRGQVVVFDVFYSDPSFAFSYGAWAEPHTVRCAFSSLSNRTGLGRVRIGTTLTTGTIRDPYGAFNDLRVKCKYSAPFVMHFDQLATS